MRFLTLAVIVLLVAGAAYALFSLRSGISYRNPADAAATSTPQQSAMDREVASMSLRDKIASLLVLHVSGTATSTLAKYVATYHPGGLILMEDNIPATISELKAETDAIQSQAPSGFPFFIATDQEGCTVRRLKSDNYPCPTQLGTEPVADTEAAFKARSTLLQRAGINLNFGIVADVTSDPNSFIYPRVFGGDPQAVASRVAAAVQGTEGITLSTLKHFPGHGETEENSHLTVPVTTTSMAAWRSRDALPFEAGVAAGADFVMFGQLEYSAVDSEPATLSKTWHQILTDQLGFKGITITDDMFMLQESGEARFSDPVANAVAALKAGSTMLLYVNDHGAGTDLNIDQLIGGIAAAVQNGTIPESVIDQDVEKTLAARAALPH